MENNIPLPPPPKKSSKITDIVRLQQILKKWKKIASKNTTTTTATGPTPTTTGKTIKLLKKTLSFSDINSAASAASSSSDVVPKGFLAVCVGKELKRFIIPTEYLGHKAFQILLREAEEEFGFQQEGVLKIPCEVSVFEKILKIVERKKDLNSELGGLLFNAADDHHQKKDIIGINISLTTPTSHHHPQLCR